MSYRILIVDDNEINLDLVGKILKWDGYEVISAISGAEALQKIGISKPDLAILDLRMPDIDGFELCRRIHQIPACEDLPVIMLTAASNDADKVQAKKAGANDLIEKPFDMDTLRVKINSLLG